MSEQQARRYFVRTKIRRPCGQYEWDGREYGPYPNRHRAVDCKTAMLRTHQQRSPETPGSLRIEILIRP